MTERLAPVATTPGIATGLQEHVSALRELTRCRCSHRWGGRPSHASLCKADFRAHVEALVDEVNRGTRFAPGGERRDRPERPKFPNLPEPMFCGFACFRRRHHRGLHHWEAAKLGWTQAIWRAHLAETNRPVACILDAGRWSEVRDPCD